MVPAALVRADDWPQWRGPQGNGVSQESIAAAGGGLKILWRQNVGTGYAPASVRDGRLYTMGWKDDQDVVSAFNADKGEPLWTHTYSCEQHNNMHEGGPAAAPAADEQRVYTLSRAGDLYCLNSTDGRVVWSKQLRDEFGLKLPDWSFSGSPVLLGKVLLVELGRVFAFQKETGELIWKTDDYGASYSTPQPFKLNGRQFLAAFPKPGLVVLDASTGDELAAHEWRTKYDVNAATPIVHGDRVFISSGYNRGCAMLRLHGDGIDVVWEGRQMRNQMATSVLIDGHLYGFDESRLKCVDADGGGVLWKERAFKIGTKKHGFGKGTLVAADGALVVLSADGELLIAPASPDGFNPAAQIEAFDTTNCWTMPVVANGRIYCRSADGQLVCVGW